ncbi:histidine-tRNA ligase isoform X2 [Wolffia australiana]
MSEGQVRKVSRRDIQLVQNLIERCLQLYMNQKEVVETLELNARIEPGFTELVWQKLEEENREFFKAYHIRLMLKNQIIIFNELLQKQVDIMQGFPLPSNVTHATIIPEIPSAEHVPTCTLATLTAAQNAEFSIIHGTNGAKMKMEPPVYSCNPDLGFCMDSGFPDCPVPQGDEPVQGFGGSEFHVQPLNEHLVDLDAASFGILGRIPRNFSFSDLTEDFTQSTAYIDCIVNVNVIDPLTITMPLTKLGDNGRR